MLRARRLLQSHSQRPGSGSPLVPGLAWEMTPAPAWLPRAAGSAAVAAPSACAISERRSGI